MAGAVGIVFGLCVLSFTLGAALMYVVQRRREVDASSPSAEGSSPGLAEQTWVEKPSVEPVEDEYDTRPIHRNPVMGLSQLEPALAALAEPVVEPEPVAEPEVETVAEPVVVAVAEPEPEVAEPEFVEPEAEAEAVEEASEPAEQDQPLETVAEAVVSTALPPPAEPQAAEHTTWVEREHFRQRYLRTFDEVRRKAGSN